MGDNTGGTLDELEAVLLRIPGADRLVKDVRELRALLVDRRAPRIAVIGRRGSGKSSLANALIGAPVLETGSVADTTQWPRWIDVVHSTHRLRWLDTPGLRAGDRPERRDEVRRALANEPPDVVLVTSKATQVDAGIDEDLAEIVWLMERQQRVGLVPPALIGVLTKADELPPVPQRTPPFEGEKRANIDRATDILRAQLEKRRLAPRDVVPVSTYQKFFANGDRVVDWRWNIDRLSEVIFAALPVATHAEAARAFEAAQSLRRRVARRIVSSASGLAFIIGITPWVPVADMALLTPLQSAMITGVAYLGRTGVDKRAVSEWMASLGVNVGAGFAMRELARALLKLFGPTNTLSAAIAASGTWALGMSAIKYFIDGGSLDEAKQAFEAAKREGVPRGLLPSGIEGADAKSEDAADPVPVPRDSGDGGS
jgi:predicted GTPase/uncharacterized protein (DUF697 family)